MECLYCKENKYYFLVVKELEKDGKTPMISFKLEDGKISGIERGRIPTENIYTNDVDRVSLTEGFIESFLIAILKKRLRCF